MASRMQQERNRFQIKTGFEFIPLQIHGSCLQISKCDERLVMKQKNGDQLYRNYIIASRA
jgi:hypothetical protein